MSEFCQIDYSLYSRVSHTLSENHGRLPDDFILNTSNDIGGITISEGCLDKLLFRYGPDVDPAPYEHILEVAEVDEEAACYGSERIFSEVPVRYVLMQEEMHVWLSEHHDLMQKECVHAFLKRRIYETSDVEELKFLLDACRELDRYEPQLQVMIRKLAESSEIASYCYPALRKFPDGNEVIYQIARNSEGQAKAEAIYELCPDNEEKKRWLIEHGKPKYLGWYSTGAVIAGKCDFQSLLDDPDLSVKDRDRIGEITSCFLEEGAAVGLRQLPDWEGLCRKYIHMVRENPSSEGISNISHEYECLEKAGNHPAVVRLIGECEEAMNDENILRYAKERVSEGKDMFLSDILFLPYDEKTVFTALCTDFKANYRNITYLNEVKYKEEAFRILFQQKNMERQYLIPYIQAMKDESLLKETDTDFHDRCMHLLEKGLKECRGPTLETIRYLRKEGIELDDSINAYMKTYELKQREEEQKYPLKRKLLKQMRPAEMPKRS